MTIQNEKEAGYITLKEASERFGYSPDYIGQLIRKGKIEGKQVYANVAWMTTVGSVEEYIGREKRTAKTEDQTKIIDQIFNYFFSEQGTLYLSIGLRALLGILIFAALLVFYFLSIAFDHKMTKDAERALFEKLYGVEISQVVVDANHISYDK